MTAASEYATQARLLSGRASDPALVVGDRTVTYGDLDDLVTARRRQLGTTRRLVMVVMANTLDPVVTYLAALSGGHVVLLVADGPHPHTTLIDTFDPDVIAQGQAHDGAIIERRPGTRHTLHPDLAMLASTSGSTGSPKLVRLSLENLLSNAEAIGEYLRLTSADRAATTLPLQYCYGLSVLNSHLLAGASLLLTERSVTDESFWTEFADAGATSFAGVPYTFELLDASGFAHRELPTLRYVTQAGGRLDVDSARRHLDLATRRGYDFFTMYGQTEATARMAYVPPALAASAIGAIGRAIPGGSLRVDPLDDAATEPDAVGELVYQGPNVMMGYAESPADLALGATLTELRTGDLGRRRPDGLFEIVGRLNRFSKLYGIRADLDQLERTLAADGIDARIVSDDDRRLLVFVGAARHIRRATALVVAATGIPAHDVAGFAVDAYPRTPSGKIDSVALRAHAADAERAHSDTDGGRSVEQLRDLYAQLLARPDATADDSFTSLGGDSLSFVELSVRLEQHLGTLPREWPRLTIAELSTLADASAAVEGTEAPAPDRGWRRWPRVETVTVLRAVAILLVVATHADLLFARGGAHVLLILLGFGIARFQLTEAPPGIRSRRLLRAAARIAIPAVLWIGFVSLLTAQYPPSTVLLVHGFLPDADGSWDSQWAYWFIELAVWGMLALAALFALRVVDRWERARPFVFALTLLVALLALRYAVTGVETGLVERYTLPAAGWLVALGWAAARADRWWQRLLLSGVLIAGMIGFFGTPMREVIVIVGGLVLLWLPTVRLPRQVVPVLVLLAGSSLFVYLTHWTVFPMWEHTSPLLGVVLSFAVGFAAWRAYQLAERRLRGLLSAAAPRDTAPLRRRP